MPNKYSWRITRNYEGETKKNHTLEGTGMGIQQRR